MEDTDFLDIPYKSLGYPIWIKVHINVKIKSLGYPYGYPKNRPPWMWRGLNASGVLGSELAWDVVTQGILLGVSEKPLVLIPKCFNFGRFGVTTMNIYHV